MDLLKVALFAVMALSLGLMWHERDHVVDAYRQDTDGPTELRLSGVALDFEKTDLPASPYVVHSAPDTRRRPMSLLFTAPEVDPVAMIGGKAGIGGSVRIDGQPASGAVVRLERHTADGVGIRDVIVGGDGKYSARNLPGGRYRARSWLPGGGAMTASDVFFLAADETVSRSYNLQAIDPEPRIEYINGGTMTVGLTGSFGVIMSRHDVDADGRMVTVPVAGVSVSAEFSSDVALLGAPVITTNEQGLAQFRLRCERTGTGRASVTTGGEAGETGETGETTTVALAPCVAPPPTTQPAEPDSDGGNTGPVTTTKSGLAPGTDGTGRAPGSVGGGGG